MANSPITNGVGIGQTCFDAESEKIPILTRNMIKYCDVRLKDEIDEGVLNVIGIIDFFSTLYVQRDPCIYKLIRTTY